ncbi:hypothetical protein LTS18_010505, partial [Coniosporium uncinatum]
MATPVNEKGEPQYLPPFVESKNSDEEGTVVGDGSVRNNSPQNRRRSVSHLTVETHPDVDHLQPIHSLASPSQTRAEANRLNDDLAMLQIERKVSEEAAKSQDEGGDMNRSRSMHRARSRREDPVDDFD